VPILPPEGPVALPSGTPGGPPPPGRAPRPSPAAM